MQGMVRAVSGGSVATHRCLSFRIVVVGLAVGIAGSACGHHKERLVTVTRYRDSRLAGLAKLPLCPTPAARKAGGLAERDLDDICLFAAKKKGIPIAREENQQCLQVHIAWRVQASGAEGECSYVGPMRFTSECTSRDVYRHTLKLVLADPKTESPVVESRTFTESSAGEINSASAYALCKAAFFSFPHPLQGKLVSVDYEK
jgi:hypothetical protein